jgi:sugar lactone lactonase YvrE
MKLLRTLACVARQQVQFCETLTGDERRALDMLAGVHRGYLAGERLRRRVASRVAADRAREGAAGDDAGRRKGADSNYRRREVGVEIDDHDNILLTEYRTSKAALFDPKTEKFTEYSLPQYTFPYRANFDKNGEIWASTMSTDRVVRLDPKTGQAVQYLMPSDTNMRTVFVDNSTTPVTFWVGSNHDHRIVKVEPLD